MLRRTASIIIFFFVSCAATVAAQGADRHVDEAIELFGQGEYVRAAELFEQIDAEQPANYLKLNAMVAWFKAERCEEAMRAHGQVDREARLESADIEDLDRVGTSCKLEEARGLADAGSYNDALGILDTLDTKHAELRTQVIELRDDVLARKEAARAAQDQPTETEQPEETVEPPPEPKPATPRPRRVLITGIGLLAGGAALGGFTLVKWLAFDNPAFDAGLDKFAQAYDCPEGLYQKCSTSQIIAIQNDEGYKTWNRESVSVADAVTVSLGVTAGVLGVTGGVMILYYALSGSPESDAPKAVLLPSVGPDFGGAVFNLQF